jgi:hypothetical protein
LVSKNRRLLEDLTKLRVSFEDLSSQHSRSEGTIENLEAEMERVKVLNERLENDLMQVNKGEERSGGAGQGLAGLEIGKVVSDEVVVGARSRLKSQLGGTRFPCSLHKQWRLVDPAHCYQSTGPFPPTQCRARRGESRLPLHLPENTIADA